MLLFLCSRFPGIFLKATINKTGLLLWGRGPWILNILVTVWTDTRVRNAEVMLGAVKMLYTSMLVCWYDIDKCACRNCRTRVPSVPPRLRARRGDWIVDGERREHTKKKKNENQPKGKENTW